MDVGSMVTSALQGNPVMLQSQVSTSVLKISMDQMEKSGVALVRMMEQSVAPNLGQNIDVRV